MDNTSSSQHRPPLEVIYILPEEKSNSSRRNTSSPTCVNHKLERELSDQKIVPLDDDHDDDDDEEPKEEEKKDDKHALNLNHNHNHRSNHRVGKSHKSLSHKPSRENQDRPPMDEIFIHILPEKEIAVYHRRKRLTNPASRSSIPRRNMMQESQPRYNRSMNDLKPLEMSPNKQSQHSLEGRSKSARCFGEQQLLEEASSRHNCINNNNNNNINTRPQVDLYCGATLTSTRGDAFTTFATLDSKTNAAFITIAPGVKARIRGAKETHDCVKRDYYVPSSCYNCNLDLYSILDASFVLCPKCKVVSPLDGKKRRDGGVGLGFTHEELQLWQSEGENQNLNTNTNTNGTLQEEEEEQQQQGEEEQVDDNVNNDAPAEDDNINDQVDDDKNNDETPH